MDKAFDVDLNRVIGVDEYQANDYRMHDIVCPCCKKEVKFIRSGQYRPYFRHAHGTFSLDCEKYVLSMSSRNIPSSEIEKHNEARITLKWEKDNTIGFSLNIKFVDRQLQTYEDNGSYFRYWTSNCGHAIESVHTYKISYENFVPDVGSDIHLDNIGDQLNFEIDNKRNSIDFVSSFVLYRLKGELDLTDHDTIVANSLNSRNRNVYINKPYVLVMKNTMIRDVKISGVNIIKSVSITPTIVALLIIIPNYNCIIKDLLDEYDYNLVEASEECTFLWPPVIETQDSVCTKKASVYLRTNFELKKDYNINSNFNLCDEIYEVIATDKIKIYYSDEVNVINVGRAPNISYQTYQPIVKNTNRRDICVQNDNCYLFSSDRPIMALSNGTLVWLTNGDEIREYQDSYLIRKTTVYEDEPKIKISIDEILQNNKVEIELQEKDLSYLENDENIIRYLDLCRRRHRINPMIQDMLRRKHDD